MTDTTFLVDRSRLHPEICDSYDDQLCADRDWFALHPELICCFRPATDFDAAPANAYGRDLPYLSPPEEAPLAAQTWIALVDAFRLAGLHEAESVRIKFRCLPVEFNDPQQVEYATARAIDCAKWCLDQHRQGAAAVGYVQTPKRLKPKGFA
jgi:hypothetical protein